MAIRMQQRRGTAQQWTTANPILNPGEIGWESDNNKFKIGDGTNHWADLNYFVDGAELSNIIDGAPALLDTLNELAAAIGDDPSFFTTVATNLTNHQNDTTNVHGIADTAELATKAFAASLLTGATLSNITITGDKNGLTISAENGVADSTTDNLTEGSTNKYFTNERAQDAVGDAVGTGLSYNDSTGAISLNASTTDVSEGTNLYFTDERAQDAVGDAVGTGLSYDDATGAISVDTLTIATQEYVDGAVSNAEVDQSTLAGTGIEWNVATSQFDVDTTLIAELASPTFTGTVTTDDLIVNGDFTVNGTNFSASATSITIEDNMLQLAHENAANTVDLGLVVGYTESSVAKHSGIVRDVSADAWKLFKGVTTEPSTTVDFTQGSLDDLHVAGLTASSISVGDVSNTEFGYLNGVTSGIQTQLDAKLESSDLTGYATESYVDGALSNAEVDQSTLAGVGISWNAGTSQFDLDTVATTLGGTGLTGYTAGDMIYASGTDTLAKLAKGSANQVMYMNDAGTAPEWRTAAAGAAFSELMLIGA
jgi:Major tropism determinant N-terminal domain